MLEERLPVPLSILDAIAIGPGVNAHQAVRWTADVAKMADQLGYYRFWLVEHHGVSDIGCASPAVMISHIAGVTKSMRIGSGGVMLPNHSPLSIAEQFMLLEALYPGRIDLGLGRAGSNDNRINQALGRRMDDPLSFETQLSELFGFLGAGFPSGHPYANVPIPLRGMAPPAFLLGSSESSAMYAAKRGMSYAFAHHINPTATAAALNTYRQNFERSLSSDEPYCIVTVAVVCAETRTEAEESAYRSLIPKMRRSLASRFNIPIDDEILLHPEWSAVEIEAVKKDLLQGWIVLGSRQDLADGLIALQNETGADEIMLTTVEYDGPSRMRSLNAVASACLSQTTFK